MRSNVNRWLPTAARISSTSATPSPGLISTPISSSASRPTSAPPPSPPSSPLSSPASPASSPLPSASPSTPSTHTQPLSPSHVPPQPKPSFPAHQTAQVKGRLVLWGLRPSPLVPPCHT
ncbi:hypothetical protein PCASD_24457 [Puccinia coronata f. sp. avenae]|uniref:Uncharacterized protein n=1 Tax=Puccinia coronata f. sp. avenae TaxID=200324 RepID=A0A2N5TJ91_9BASI|nr:hypothetical protein PCASD_24457 [Puccinia coronata f. sp. avenae]